MCVCVFLRIKSLVNIVEIEECRLEMMKEIKLSRDKRDKRTRTAHIKACKGLFVCFSNGIILTCFAVAEVALVSTCHDDSFKFRNKLYF